MLRSPLVFLALLVLGCASGFKHVEARSLTSADELACEGHLVWDREPVEQIVLSLGGTGTRSTAFVHPSLSELMRARRVGLLTFDKPGVRAVFGEPDDVQYDDAALQQHTQGHLVDCALQALVWTRERFGDAVRVHVRGHSEGALLALDLLIRLKEQQPGLNRQVETLLLSGVPLEPFGQLLERQLDALPSNGAPIRRAIDACDWPEMRRLVGFSCGYLKDATRRPAGRQMFEALAAVGANQRIVIVQGNADTHTPARYVRELAAWNVAHGGLDLEVQYYQGDHRGGSQGRRAMQDALWAMTAPAARGSTPPK
jgi:pimeloyl-ACP methyl ester carboxylesterase